MCPPEYFHVLLFNLLDLCKDTDPNCAQYPAQQKETKDDYCQRPWPQHNCQRFCGVCKSMIDGN